VGRPVPPVDESHRVMLSALEALRSTRTATDGPRGHAPRTRVGSQDVVSRGCGSRACIGRCCTRYVWAAMTTVACSRTEPCRSDEALIREIVSHADTGFAGRANG